LVTANDLPATSNNDSYKAPGALIVPNLPPVQPSVPKCQICDSAVANSKANVTVQLHIK
jgi:hypothetical protein